MTLILVIYSQAVTPTTAKDMMLQMVSQQEMDGYWKYTKELTLLLEIGENDLTPLDTVKVQCLKILRLFVWHLNICNMKPSVHWFNK